MITVGVLTVMKLNHIAVTMMVSLMKHRSGMTLTQTVKLMSVHKA